MDKVEIKCPNCEKPMAVTPNPWMVHCDICHYHWITDGEPEARYFITVIGEYSARLDGSCLINCPFCGQQHIHTWKRDGYPAWRDSHCGRGSYFIKKVGGEPE
jgi:hypothetical protein